MARVDLLRHDLLKAVALASHSLQQGQSLVQTFLCFSVLALVKESCHLPFPLGVFESLEDIAF